MGWKAQNLLTCLCCFYPRPCSGTQSQHQRTFYSKCGSSNRIYSMSWRWDMSRWDFLSPRISRITESQGWKGPQQWIPKLATYTINLEGFQKSQSPTFQPRPWPRIPWVTPCRGFLCCQCGMTPGVQQEIWAPLLSSSSAQSDGGAAFALPTQGGAFSAPILFFKKIMLFILIYFPT